jgi:putative hydrolase of the HAD superfamily
MVAPRIPHIDLDGVEGVLLDLDGTLYAYEPCHQAGLDACAALDGQALEPEEFKLAYRKHRTMVTQRLQPQGSCRSRLLAFQSLFESLGCSQAFSLALEYERQYWSHFIDAMRLAPSADELLHRCRDAGIRCCVVTDMTAQIQIRKLAQLGISKKIDFLVTSEEAGAEKPDARIFELALEKLGVSPGRAVMIGDNQAKDIDGASAVGVAGYLVEGKT